MMPSDTQTPEKAQPEPSSKALMPLISTPEDIEPENLDQLMALANLTSKQQRILIALVRNIAREIPHTDIEIAADIGTSTQYIWDCRQNPRFCSAMGVLIKNLARGTQDKAFAQLMKHAEKSDRATEIWLKMGETFVPTQRNLNINAQIGAIETPGSPQQAASAIAEQFIEVGYDRQAYIEILTEAYDTLKSEGI